MKKYIKIGILVLIALIFIGTFVFLYQKSQPKDTKYDIQKVETTNLVQTTVATGKIEPRTRYRSSRRFRVSLPKYTKKRARK